MEAHKIAATHKPVVGCWMVFRKVVGEIVGAFTPVNDKLLLGDVVAHPVEAHVNGFRPALFYSYVAYPCCTGIVGLDGGWWLGVSHVNEGCAQPRCILGVEEQGTKFGLVCR
jgi:hypothetical protein